MTYRRMSGPLAVALSGYVLSACVGATSELTAPEADLFADDAGAGSGTHATTTTGLPCAVDDVLQRACRSCHGTRPSGGAPMALVTYADLLAATPTSVSLSAAQRSLQMMQASTMPPGGGLASADLATFAAWVQSGMAMGNCSADAGTSSDPYGTAAVCTSQKTWTGGNRESPLMHPGDACISCHSKGEGPRFALAGTLYPTAHEPTDCNGTSAADANVIVTDANGSEHTLVPNAAGNFYVSGSIAKPYRARIVYQGRTRTMESAQSSGDCNSCHTEAGSQGAPGRLMLP